MKLVSLLLLLFTLSGCYYRQHLVFDSNSSTNAIIQSGKTSLSDDGVLQVLIDKAFVHGWAADTFPEAYIVLRIKNISDTDIIVDLQATRILLLSPFSSDSRMVFRHVSPSNVTTAELSLHSSLSCELVFEVDGIAPPYYFVTKTRNDSTSNAAQEFKVLLRYK